MTKNKSRADGFRVGIDIGGTFTDIVFMNKQGKVHIAKVSSTPDNYNRGIVSGLEQVFQDAGLTASDIVEVVHGCTVATNAILEHTGGQTGLITTKGFRDVLQIRRLRAPVIGDTAWVKPPPLSPRELRLEVDERINYAGNIVRPLNPKEVEEVVGRLVAKGVKSIAVCLINSYANPIHEQKIKEIINNKYPDLFVDISTDLIRIIREYERTSETVVNAYVKPVVVEYMHALEKTMRSIDVKAPLLVMQSSGGMMSAQAAGEKPMYIIECGPAAGVVGSNFLAKRLGIPNVLTLDMGGTTTKASIIENGEATIASSYEVGAGISMASRLSAGAGYVIRVPSVDIAEIGAGGGSKLWLDVGGALHVGPRSAGSVPGPVCYDAGGTEATLTDANLVLGYLPEYLAGGTVRLKKDKATEAIETQIAKPNKMDTAAAAWGAYMIANSNMMRAIRAVSTVRGRDPRDFTLFAYGGAGPIHAAALAREMEVKRVVVTPTPGLFSAFGLLFAEIEHHFSETILHRLDQSVVDIANKAWTNMKNKALAEIEAGGYGDIKIDIIKTIDARYIGQGSELRVTVPWDTLLPEHVQTLIEAFNEEHLKTYAHKRLDEPVDIVNLRLVARVSFPEELLPEGLKPAKQTVKVTKTGKEVRKAYFGKNYGWLETSILQKEDLTDKPVKGPMIIEYYDATCVVPPYAKASRGAWGTINIDIQI